MSNPTVLVEYIGKQKNRGDDVLNTPRVWPTPGSVVEMPEREAPHYLAHPGEWRTITPEELEQREAARDEVTKTVEALSTSWKSLPLKDLYALNDEIADEIDLREAENRAKGAQAPEKVAEQDEAPVSTEDGDDASKTAASERVQKVMSAIKQLDSNNEDHFAKAGPRAGSPKTAPVSEIAGFKVTAAEIDEANALLKADG